jgi:hypothetical protein
MFYRNFRYPLAVEQLALAVNGGRTEDGLPIQGLPLSNDTRVSEYYYTYGLALARTNQCGEALKLSQTLQANLSNDENAMAAATEIIKICEENLNNPVCDTPVATEEDLTATADVATSEAVTPEATATP